MLICLIVLYFLSSAIRTFNFLDVSNYASLLYARCPYLSLSRFVCRLLNSTFISCIILYYLHAKMVRTCPGKPGAPCGKFRSSLVCDPHTLCKTCRGKDCTNESKCVECDLWSDDQ